MKLLVTAILSLFTLGFTLNANELNSLKEQDFLRFKQSLKYPRFAIENKMEGKFVLYIYFDSESNISFINYETDNAPIELIRHSISIAENMKFSKTYKNTTIKIPLNFKLL